MDYRELHKNALVIDSHNDTIVAHIRRGNASFFSEEAESTSGHSGTISFLRGHQAPRPGATYLQIDFSKMRQAGINAAFFAIDVTLARNNHLAYALDGFGYLLNDIDRHQGRAAIVRKADDILDAKAAGLPAAILAIEHADCVERSLNVLRILYEVGVRSIGLTHNVSSWAADGCLEARDGVGLTLFGKALVQEMNHLGILLDLAHVSPSGFYDAIDVSTKPVVFSHGNARALCDHPRNLTDGQLKILGQNGGVIGMSYVPFFVAQEDPTIEDLLNHIDHVAEVAGIETVALGSDFDGGGTLLRDATEEALITKGLIARGYSEADIRKILGENTLRVLRATIG